MKKFGQEFSHLFGLNAVNDGVEAAGDDVKQDSREFSVVRVLREAMQDDDEHTAPEHDQVDEEVSAASLQGLTVQ